MTRILCFLVVVIGCSSPKPKGYELPPALREVFRGGELAPLQNATSTTGMPSPYDQVSHTCVSTPLWDLEGRYTRTDIRCW